MGMNINMNIQMRGGIEWNGNTMNEGLTGHCTLVSSVIYIYGIDQSMGVLSFHTCMHAWSPPLLSVA